MSPVVLREGGFRFYFFANENQTATQPAEPAHVHVERATPGRGRGKLWLAPAVAWDWQRGFTAAEQRRIFKIVTANAVQLRTEYDAYHSR